MLPEAAFSGLGCLVVDFSHSAMAADYLRQVSDFVRTEIEPVEPEYHRALHAGENPWTVLPVVEELKAKARSQGLWNLFLPDTERGAGLSNVEYAPLA